MSICIHVIFWLSAFVIFWAMIGYPLSLRMFKNVWKENIIKKDENYLPTVTVMIVAHNEEIVVGQYY